MSSNTPENPYAGQARTAPTPYGQAPYGQAPYGQAPATDPGKTMAIISIILPFIMLSLVGLVLAIVAKVKSKNAGYTNTLALVSIIINIVFLVGSIIAIIVATVYFANLANDIATACMNGAESVTVNGQVLSCASVNP